MNFRGLIKILCLISALMEKQSSKINLSLLFHSVRTIMHSVLAFLNCSDLTILCSTYANSPDSDPKIAKMIAAYLYIQKHLLATDRSFYYTLYDNPRFRKFQQSYFAYLLEKPQKLAALHQTYFNIILQLSTLFKSAQTQQLLQLVQQLTDDPEIPMGKLLRENVGAGCTSQFQHFLVGLGCQETNENVEEELVGLEQFLEERFTSAYTKQFLYILKDSTLNSLRPAIRKLRISSHQIDFANAQEYMVPNNQLHNIIVCLFALAQQLTQSTQLILTDIYDPSHMLLQFMLRYSMYRNFIISIQEKFSFLFRNYSELYSQTFQDSHQYPAFNFWRPALSKWFVRMSKFHSTCNETFNLYLFSQRINNSMAYIETKWENDSNFCSQNLPKFRNLNNKILLDTKGISQSQLGTNIELKQDIAEEIQVLVREYSDYMMDISIDEVTVNWCGHTQQKLNFPFQKFSQTISAHSEKLFRYLLTLGPDLRKNKELVENDLTFLQENNYLKCKNIHQLNTLANLILNEVSNGEIVLQRTFENMSEDLEYYNAKRKIPMQIENSKLRRFSQIVPLTLHELKEQIMHKLSLDSTAISNSLSESSNFIIYDSDEEQNDNGQTFTQEQLSSDVLNQFMEDESEMLDQSENLYAKLIN